MNSINVQKEYTFKACNEIKVTRGIFAFLKTINLGWFWKGKSHPDALVQGNTMHQLCFLHGAKLSVCELNLWSLVRPIQPDRAHLSLPDNKVWVADSICFSFLYTYDNFLLNNFCGAEIELFWSSLWYFVHKEMWACMYHLQCVLSFVKLEAFFWLNRNALIREWNKQCKICAWVSWYYSRPGNFCSVSTLKADYEMSAVPTARLSISWGGIAEGMTFPGGDSIGTEKGWWAGKTYQYVQIVG